MPLFGNLASMPLPDLIQRLGVSQKTGNLLIATLPNNSAVLIPGYYLLFLTGAYDAATTTHYRDVPSIATWVRLQASGLDLCDQVVPAPITDFTPDVVGQTFVAFTWTGPGE
jgi:hypothetical protein